MGNIVNFIFKGQPLENDPPLSLQSYPKLCYFIHKYACFRLDIPFMRKLASLIASMIVLARTF